MQAGSEVSILNRFTTVIPQRIGHAGWISIRHYSGEQRRSLGAMPLKDDDEARLFGVGVIRD